MTSAVVAAPSVNLLTIEFQARRLAMIASLRQRHFPRQILALLTSLSAHRQLEIAVTRFGRKPLRTDRLTRQTITGISRVVSIGLRPVLRHFLPAETPVAGAVLPRSMSDPTATPVPRVDSMLRAVLHSAAVLTLVAIIGWFAAVVIAALLSPATADVSVPIYRCDKCGADTRVEAYFPMWTCPNCGSTALAPRE